MELIIALALVTRRLDLQNEQHQNFIQQNNNLLILEIQKYISVLEERFPEQQKNESHYSCPAQSSGEGQNRKGRPKFHIPHEQLQGLRSLGFTWNAVAQMLGVSDKTIRRRREEYNMSEHGGLFSDISDDEIDTLVKHGLEVSMNSGERMIMGWFRGIGIRIQRWRLRDAIARVDPVGRALRRKTVTKRRAYSVPTPNSLW